MNVDRGVKNGPSKAANPRGQAKRAIGAVLFAVSVLCVFLSGLTLMALSDLAPAGSLARWATIASGVTPLVIVPVVLIAALAGLPWIKAIAPAISAIAIVGVIGLGLIYLSHYEPSYRFGDLILLTAPALCLVPFILAMHLLGYWQREIKSANSN